MFFHVEEVFTLTFITQNGKPSYDYRNNFLDDLKIRTFFEANRLVKDVRICWSHLQNSGKSLLIRCIHIIMKRKKFAIIMGSM